jgi:hypothetical protein
MTNSEPNYPLIESNLMKNQFVQSNNNNNQHSPSSFNNNLQFSNETSLNYINSLQQQQYFMNQINFHIPPSQITQMANMWPYSAMNGGHNYVGNYPVNFNNQNYGNNNSHQNYQFPSPVINNQQLNNLPYGYSNEQQLKLLQAMSLQNQSQMILNTNNEVYQKQQQQQQKPFMTNRRSGLANELHVCLEECSHQLNCLETERKRIEIEISQLNSRLNDYKEKNELNSLKNVSIPRLANNPSRVDRLIVEAFREVARIADLIIRIDLSATIFFSSIELCLNKWVESIRFVQLKRSEEIVNVSMNRRRFHNQTDLNRNDKDVLSLIVAINDLSLSTARVRTTLWCCLQISNVNLKETITQIDQTLVRKIDKKAPFSSLEAAYHFVKESLVIKTDLNDLKTV